jgi:hypothetical protein
MQSVGAVSVYVLLVVVGKERMRLLTLTSILVLMAG